MILPCRSLTLQRKRTTHIVSQQWQRERAIIGHARFSFVTEILFHLSASLSFLPPSCPGAASSCQILGKIMRQLRTVESDVLIAILGYVIRCVKKRKFIFEKSLCLSQKTNCFFVTKWICLEVCRNRRCLYWVSYKISRQKKKTDSVSKI